MHPLAHRRPFRAERQRGYFYLLPSDQTLVHNVVTLAHRTNCCATHQPKWLGAYCVVSEHRSPARNFVGVCAREHFHCHNLSQKAPQLDNLSSPKVQGNGFTRMTVCPWRDRLLWFDSRPEREKGCWRVLPLRSPAHERQIPGENENRPAPWRNSRYSVGVSVG